MAMLRAREAFSCDVGNPPRPRIVTEGHLVPDDDPVVKGREHLFEKLPDYQARLEARGGPDVKATPPVETAAQAPGEKRASVKGPSGTKG